MTVKLIVGYRTRAVPGLQDLMPQFEPARNLKDPIKIEAYLQEKKEAFLVEAKDQPYTGTFDEVFISDPESERVGQWRSEGRKPWGDKPPICLAVRKWLLQQYGKAWEDDLKGRPRESGVLFVGFNPRLFLKILGVECSLPEYDEPLPPAMWYGNPDHRDIMEAIWPHDFKHLTLDLVLKRRRAASYGDVWDQALKGWTGPGVNPEQDVWLATVFCHQLGFLQQKKAAPVNA